MCVVNRANLCHRCLPDADLRPLAYRCLQSMLFHLSLVVFPLFFSDVNSARIGYLQDRMVHFYNIIGLSILHF